MSTRPILIGGDSDANLSGFAPEPVSLAVVKASKIPVEWYESVAIVQEASRHLLDSPRLPQPGRELSVATVRIDMTGKVIVSGDAAPEGASAVSQLGALLRDLMPDNMPVPLRLAVSQAMSNPPHYASIKSFSEALAYFERPDRMGIIRALYERWEAIGSGRLALPSHVEPASESQPAPEKPARRAPGRAPHWMVAAGAIGLAITLGLAVAANWMRISTAFSINRQVESSAPASDRPADGSALGSPIPEAAQPGRTNNRPVPLRVAPGSNQDARVEPGLMLSNGSAAPVPDLTTVGKAPVSAEESLRSANQSNASVDQIAASATVERAPGSRTYSALDTDVSAPVAAYPQSSSVATVLEDDEMLTFDLVIDENGKVESVKLRRAPSSIRSALMLTMSMSVAKAWRFQPATRHGQSVKYRQSISVPAPK